MVPLEVLGIVQETRGHPVIILRHEDRFLPIVVGLAEAEAIQGGLMKRDLGRPMTHDLVCNLLAGLRGEIKSIVIYKLESETFYAHLNIEQKAADGTIEQVLRVDTRPSDGIAIAARLDTPIFAGEQVMDEASRDISLLNIEEDDGDEEGEDDETDDDDDEDADEEFDA